MYFVMIYINYPWVYAFPADFHFPELPAYKLVG